MTPDQLRTRLWSGIKSGRRLPIEDETSLMWLARKQFIGGRAVENTDNLRRKMGVKTNIRSASANV